MKKNTLNFESANCWLKEPTTFKVNANNWKLGFIFIYLLAHLSLG